MNFSHLALETALEEVLRLYISSEFARMISMLRHHKNERLHLGSAADAVVAIQLDGDVIVVMNGILKFDLLQLLSGNRPRVKIFARGNRRLFDETVGHRFAQA